LQGTMPSALAFPCKNDVRPRGNCANRTHRLVSVLGCILMAEVAPSPFLAWTSAASRLHQWWPPSAVRRACRGIESEAAVRDEIQGLKAREIKKKLEAMGVNAGDAFEKDELILRYVEAKMQGVEQESAESEGTEDATDKTAEISAECRVLRVSELREQLGRRGIPWADAFEKDELVQRLTAALVKEAQYCKSGRIKPGIVAHLTGSELEEELRDSSTPVLLDVYATWCGPCQLMAPHLDAAAQKLGSKVRIAKLDSDKDPAMASKLRVGGLPTMILFNADGQEVTRQEGALMEQQIISLVDGAQA